MRIAGVTAVAAVLWGGMRVGRRWWQNRRRLRRIDGALREVRRAQAEGELGRETAIVLERELESLRHQCPGGTG